MPVHFEPDLRDATVCIITRNDGLWDRLFPFPLKQEALDSFAREGSVLVSARVNGIGINTFPLSTLSGRVHASRGV